MGRIGHCNSSRYVMLVVFAHKNVKQYDGNNAASYPPNSLILFYALENDRKKDPLGKSSFPPLVFREPTLCFSRSI